MKAPGFWYSRTSAGAVAETLLVPAAALYVLAGRLRQYGARPRSVGVPVVCVGNVTAGGAGKTPAVLAILERLAGRGVAAHALSRGYGGRLKGPVRVDPSRHDAEAVGDEPLLLARRVPTWVARDRLRGARAAVAGGAEAIVMDDGFQNPAVAKDLSILAIDGAVGLGNGRVHPAGPLREPFGAAIARADAVLLIGKDETGLAARLPPHLPVWRARLASGMPVPPDGIEAADESTRWHAFAGIGRPDKFFDGLRASGIIVSRTRAFPDHHRFTPAEIETLVTGARAEGARLVTTEKDSVRLPASARAEIWTSPAHLVFEETASVDALLTERLGR